MRILQVGIYCRSTDAIQRKLILFSRMHYTWHCRCLVRVCAEHIFSRRNFIICRIECENDGVENGKGKSNFKLTLRHGFTFSLIFSVIPARLFMREKSRIHCQFNC